MNTTPRTQYVIVLGRGARTQRLLKSSYQSAVEWLQTHRHTGARLRRATEADLAAHAAAVASVVRRVRAEALNAYINTYGEEDIDDESHDVHVREFVDQYVEGALALSR